MRAYVFLLVCSQLMCIHSLTYRRIIEPRGLRSIKVRGQRNLREHPNSALRTLSFRNSTSLCQWCLQIAFYYSYDTYICSQYCSQPNIKQPTFSAGSVSTG